MPATPRLKGKKPAAKAVAPKASTKPTIAVKPKPGAAAKIATTVAKAKAPAVTFDAVAFDYDGASRPLNVNKSSTPVAAGDFNRLPNAKLTPRDESFLRGLHDEYGTKVFQRGMLDAGNLRRAMERGYVQPQEGDGKSLTSTYKLVKPVPKRIPAPAA